jgi:hypothetical protein
MKCRPNLSARLPVAILLTLSATHPVQMAAGRPSTLSEAPVGYRDGTAGAGIDFVHVNGASPDKFLAETMGSGALFFDYDGDGSLDVFLVDGGSFADPARARGARHRLYQNRGDGTFADRSTTAGIQHRGYGMGACAGDVDNDGWVDLYVTSVGPDTLYRNNTNGTFTEVRQAANTAAPLWSASCAFADVDRDGDLDLFVTHYVDATAANNPPCGDSRLAYSEPLSVRSPTARFTFPLIWFSFPPAWLATASSASLRLFLLSTRVSFATNNCNGGAPMNVRSRSLQ